MMGAMTVAVTDAMIVVTTAERVAEIAVVIIVAMIELSTLTLDRRGSDNVRWRNLY